MTRAGLAIVLFLFVFWALRYGAWWLSDRQYRRLARELESDRLIAGDTSLRRPR